MKKICLLCLVILSVSVLMAQPANDDACAPIMLTIGDDCSGTLPYDNTGATAQVGESVGECYGDGSVEQTVWFAFVAPNTGAVSVNTDFANSGMQDNQLTVYNLEGGDCTVLPNFVEIACNEDRIPGAVNTEFNAALPPFPVTAGQTYYIQVDGYYADDGDDTTNDTSEGSFCIVVDEVTTPLNDDCANPDVYGGFGPSCTKVWGDPDDPAIENASTIGATAGNDIDVFSCDGSAFNATVYYSFNAGVSEVEFNLISGENINVSLLTNPEAGCASAVEVTGNCFTGINASALPDPEADADVLFTNLTPQTSYLMAIWTEEGDETDFEFCLTRAPAYSCGDDVCYDLAESYTDCPSDCPCISSVDLYSYITGDDTTTPEAVCPEIVGDLTDPANPGLYVPFTITTNDNDLSGSSVTSNIGSLFSSSTPPAPLPNGEATNFLTYLFLTEAELAAGGNVTITFGSDDGACDASVTFAMTDLIRPQTSECGGCDLNIVPDYAAATCDGTSVQLTLAVENGIGPNVWIDQTGTTSYTAPPNGDILVALDGSTSIAFPTNDLTLIAYDEGKPNCAVRITYTSGDYVCPGDPEDGICYEADGPALACRLDPEVAEVTCAGAIIDVGSETGTVNFSPDGIVSVDEEGNYVAAIDQNNCQPIDITITDDSTCDQTPIVTIISPASVAGGINVSTNAEDWGVQIADTLPICGTPGAFSGVFAVLDDGDTAGGQLTDFCEPTPPDLPAQSVCDQISGKIAMIDRGQCNFTQKVENAQNCGAIGVVICNCQPGPGWCAADDDVLITMAAGALENEITIPAVFMLYSDCQAIKAEMNNGNDVSACIGAPETIAGCTREFTLDVCDQLPTDCGVPGCMDDTACNYNPEATEDDGSCQLPPEEPATECYETATLDNTTCTWTVTGEQDPEPDTACYETATFDATTCAWIVEGVQPTIDDGCDLTTDTFDDVTCMAVNTSTCPDNTTLNTATCMCEDIIVPGCTDMCATNYNEMANMDDGSCTLPEEPATACYETAAFDNTTCMWVVTGEQDPEPGTACYETATFDEATCAWVVTGEQDPEPDTACYETATFDEATCAWVVTGEQDPEPDTACYETATFDDATCAWVVTGEQDPEPDTACYETATFNEGTCVWDVTGTQDPEPTTACYETAAFDDGTCAWVVTGDQPEQPTDLACYESVGAFDDATCAWQVLGEQPNIDDGCDLTTDTFDDATCMAVNTSTCPDMTTLDEVNCVCATDVIPGCTDPCASNYNPDANSDDGTCMLPEEPVTACYETATFNETTCVWDISGTQPEAPATECYETAEFDDASCSWTVSGERDPEPTGLACYETTSFDDATCAWVTEGEQPPVDDGCDLTDDSFDEATCMAVNTPSCPDGSSFDADNCACTDDPIPGCTDTAACNYDPNATVEDNSCTFLPDEPTDLACYETATSNLVTCSWDVTGEQPAIDDGCDVTVDTFDDATCMAVNTPDCPAETTFNAATCNCDTDFVEVSGCMDMDACNYDSAANTDDGSCIYAVAGSISTSSSTSICVNDGVDEPIDVTVDDAGQGNNGAWVITDSDAIILALPDAPPFVLDGAGVGTCLIWWVNFSDDTFAPTVGDDAAALVAASSCAALSNSIAISRVECGTECTPPSAGDFNCDE